MALSFLAPLSAAAQPFSPPAIAPAVQQIAASPPSRRPAPLWSWTFDLGAAWGGPSKDLENAMRLAHFDDLFFFSATGDRRPYSRTEPGSLSVALTRRLKAPWSMAVVFSRTPIGWTSGYHARPTQYLHVDYGVNTFGALLFVGGPSAQIGIGPALHTARTKRDLYDSSGRPDSWIDQASFGFIARARAAWPARSHIFLDLSLDYRIVGLVDVGPYAPEASGAGTPVVVPSTSVRFDHWVIGIGPGLRF